MRREQLSLDGYAVFVDTDWPCQGSHRPGLEARECFGIAGGKRERERERENYAGYIATCYVKFAIKLLKLQTQYQNETCMPCMVEMASSVHC